MIARIFIFIILATLLPDLYIYRRYIRHRFDLSLVMRLLWWVPGAAMVAVTLVYAMIDDFAPANLTLFNIYLFMLGLIVVPKLLFVLSSIAGRGVRRMTGGTRNWGNYFGLLLVLGQLYVLFMGSMTGTDRLRVRRVTISVPNLPKSFDGYRIVQFSDIHLGSMRSELLERAVEQMNRLRPDMIAFTGDIQNMRPDELTRHTSTLRRLYAKDGVYSVLGNHDYSEYVPKLPMRQRRHNEQLTREFHANVGWQLLLNDHRIIRRGNDSIVIAGEENDGLPPFPSKADLKRTLRGVSPRSFVVMLQHDPSAWRRSILPGSNVQLTLSGHTHGGQMSLFGLRPTSLLGREDDGLYQEAGRALFVSTGLGGFVPFRFNMDPEVVEITLRSPTP
ncbi:metallophosphoesterase [uncultured Prevotella sp.]|uniref:metallophosphoesterase n=1 Tax=uncultured Prevotella sp. TaxID=159272 RepID=UPI002637A177|nr:metallophosphoesterase [uncultured Prevotella sp.]